MFGKQKQGEEKLPGPKDIPEPIGMYMVAELHNNPDWVWSLKGVIHKVGKNGFYCRVFDEVQTSKAGVKVKDWISLDAHPELILWEGYHDKETLNTRTEKFAKA